jgi:hypothetical protein
MYTTSGARNAQHQWIPSITSVGIPSYTNVWVFRPFSGDTLSSLSCSQLGSSSFLRVPRERILFSFASCVISRSDNMTPAGQPYVLATLPAFAANILRILQAQSIQVFLSIKELKRLMKVKVTTTEVGEVLEKSDAGESGDEDEDEDEDL